MKTSSFESFGDCETADDDDVDDVLLRFLLSPTIALLFIVKVLQELETNIFSLFAVREFLKAAHVKLRTHRASYSFRNFAQARAAACERIS